MWHLYEEKTYTSHLAADLRRMDRILSLMSDYENNRLQRRVWAEKMHTRQMRHFFEDEFNEVSHFWLQNVQNFLLITNN